MSGAKAIDDNYRCLMEYWFPQIEKIEKELPVDIPKTDYIALLDPELFHNVIFQRATKEDYSLLVHYINVTRGECRIGLPFFLRTGLSSDKHEWGKSCFITDDSLEALTRNICTLFESDMNKIDVRMSPYLFIREYIEMNAPFTAFNGMPIAREFRIFSDCGKLTHFQPYWIPDAISKASIDNWKEVLKEQHIITDDEWKPLVDAANKVTAEIGGHWSVDFCQGKNGTWYLIDMAVAQRSFKWKPDTFDWNFKSKDEERAEQEAKFRGWIKENKDVSDEKRASTTMGSRAR